MMKLCTWPLLQSVHSLFGRAVCAPAGRQAPGRATWLAPLYYPVEPILHATPFRMRLCGVFAVAGHVIFYLVWGLLLPQPYENLTLRLLAIVLNLPLFSSRVVADPRGPWCAWVFGVVFWLQLPVFFTWMFLCNGGNAVWLASFCAMVLIYYSLTDWRLASAGLYLGVLVAGLWFRYGPNAPSLEGLPISAMAVMSFCAMTALVLGLSSANLKQAQSEQTLATMGILAHELRTPLATLNLMGEALQTMSKRLSSGAISLEAETLAHRLQSLARQMNHQIDSQISNASLMHLSDRREVMHVLPWLTQVLQDYPYRTPAERDSVVLSVMDDFCVLGARSLMTQVINNLLRNAWRSLAVFPRPLRPGDIQIHAYSALGKGYVAVSDRGAGIDEQVMRRMFKPFFSTNQKSGHGLGLAFCHRVMTAHAGEIAVYSNLGHGARFTLVFPLHHPAS